MENLTFFSEFTGPTLEVILYAPRLIVKAGDGTNIFSIGYMTVKVGTSKICSSEIACRFQNNLSENVFMSPYFFVFFVVFFSYIQKDAHL